MTPSLVRDKMKAALNIPGLRVFDTIPDNIVPPAAVVGQLSMTWDLTFGRGADTANLDVMVITGRMSDRAAQDWLDQLLVGTGAKSIKTKIEADQTLGGSVSSLRCTNADPLNIVVSGVEMLAYRFSVVLYG